MPVERREQAIAVWIGSTGNGRNPIINGRRRPSCDGTSRMTRECQVRICERLGVKFPGPTRQQWDAADAAGWTTAERSAAVLCKFRLSSGKLDKAAPCRRQGRMASGRTLSARRLHRDEHGAPCRKCRRLLKHARYLRAMMVWTAPDGIDCARMRSLQISDNGDRPWNRLAELAWTRRSIFSSSME
jgi:hypothetical protein